jgi:ABC-type Fe3+ transport system, periplasmic component
MRVRIREKLTAVGAAIAALSLSAGSCGMVVPTPLPSNATVSCPGGDAPTGHGEGTLRVLAGSELKDLAEIKDAQDSTIIDHISSETGIRVAMSYVGTLDGLQQVISGKAGENYDAVWFPSNRYLDLYLKAHPGLAPIGTPTSIMRSPVVLGVRPDAINRLGWYTPPSWRTIASRATERQFSFAMTNPAASNSGFSALIAMATALAGTTGPLNPAQLNQVRPDLAGLFSAQQLTAGSSGWLKDAYVKRAHDGTAIDAMINYESVLLSVNRQAISDSDKLTLIYPTDGVITADYPLTPLVSGNAQAQHNERVVRDYLCQAKVQAELMTMTHRRPVRGDVSLAGEFGLQRLHELNPPDQLTVADALIKEFSNTIRRPARTIYVLDLSGSMNTKDARDPTKLDASDPPKIRRIDALRSALLGLTGVDTSLAAQSAVFHEREQVILLTFSDTPSDPQRFEIPAGSPDQKLAEIARAVDGMKAGGNAAIYDALAQAYAIAGEPTQVARYTTIVLFSDGDRTSGRDLAGFRQYYDSLPLAQRQIPVFAVMVGEGNVAELTSLSKQLTNGEFFDGNRQGSLAKVFQEIRAYQ